MSISKKAFENLKFGKFRTPLDAIFNYWGEIGRTIEKTLLDALNVNTTVPSLNYGVVTTDKLIRKNVCNCGCSCGGSQPDIPPQTGCSASVPIYEHVYHLGDTIGTFPTVSACISDANSNGYIGITVYCQGQDITESEIRRLTYPYSISIIGQKGLYEDTNVPVRYPTISTETFNGFFNDGCFIQDFTVVSKQCIGTNDTKLYFNDCRFTPNGLSKGLNSSEVGSVNAGNGDGFTVTSNKECICCHCDFSGVITGDGGDGDTCDYYASDGGSPYTTYCDNGGNGGGIYIKKAEFCTFNNVTIGGGGKGANYKSSDGYVGGRGGNCGGISGEFYACDFDKVTFNPPGIGGNSLIWEARSGTWYHDKSCTFQHGTIPNGIFGTNTYCNFKNIILLPVNSNNTFCNWHTDNGSINIGEHSKVEGMSFPNIPSVTSTADWSNSRVDGTSHKQTKVILSNNTVVKNINFGDGRSITSTHGAITGHSFYNGYYAMPVAVRGAGGGGGFAIGGSCARADFPGIGESGSYTNVHASSISFGSGGTSYGWCDNKSSNLLNRGGGGGWAGDGADWQVETTDGQPFRGGDLTVVGGSGLASSAGVGGTYLNCEETGGIASVNGTFSNTAVNENASNTIMNWAFSDDENIGDWIYLDRVYLRINDDNGDFIRYEEICMDEFTITPSSAGEAEVYNGYWRIRSKTTNSTYSSGTITISITSATWGNHSEDIDVNFGGFDIKAQTHNNSEYCLTTITRDDLQIVEPINYVYVTYYYFFSGNIIENGNNITSDCTFSIGNGNVIFMADSNNVNLSKYYYSYKEDGNIWNMYIVPYDVTSNTTLNVSYGSHNCNFDIRIS